MKRVRLQDFINCASDADHASCPLIEASLPGLHFSRGASGALILPAEVDYYPDYADLSEVESTIEKIYGLEELVLKPQLIHPLKEGDDAIELFKMQAGLSGIEKWIMRHARLQSSFEQCLFACGRLKDIKQGSLEWEVPPGICHFLRESEFSWLKLFWADSAPLALKINYVPGQAEEKVSVSLPPPQASDLPVKTTKSIPNSPKRAPSRKVSKTGLKWGKLRDNCPSLPLREISADLNLAYTEGWVEDLEISPTKSDNWKVHFLLVNGRAALACIMWTKEAKKEALEELLKNKFVRLGLELSYDDRYEHDLVGRVFSIQEASPPPSREDLSAVKRVELHMHSRFSTKDACASPADLVRKAASFGHPAVAITDHGSVQGFPDAVAEMRALARKGQPIKVILGMEGYLVDDGSSIFTGASQVDEDRCESLAAFELRAEGEGANASVRSFRGLKCRVLPGFHLESFEFLSCDIPAFDGEESESRHSCLRELSDFLKDCAFISPGGLEDLSSLRYEGFRVPGDAPRFKFNPCFIDMEKLSACLCETLPQELFQAGAAFESDEENGLEILKERLTYLSSLMKKHEIPDFSSMNNLSGRKSFEQLREEKARSYHIILLANDPLGLYHLYRLVSLSNLENFYYRPRIPRSRLRYLRAGLTLGSACVAGEIFSSVIKCFQKAGSKEEEAIRELADNSTLIARAREYDYLEIQPLDNNRFLLLSEDSGVCTEEDLRSLNRMIVALAELAGRPVCATCDAHFLDKDDEIYREIVLSSMNMDAREEPAPLFFRTTEEMLHEFAYLGEEKAQQFVVENTRAIADRIQEGMLAFPDGSFPPLIETAAEKIRTLCREYSLEHYGRNGKIPESIQSRLDTELEAIISNGYAIMYYIAHELCRQSNEDGYIVGSRGSVGSSLVATFCGISEVNPLPPHYICPHCHYFEEESSGTFGSGYDLPLRKCPECGAELLRDGQDIPFATFLGFTGNKQPDIDLNFSGEYQLRAHAFIEKMFGSSHTFRAGTIQGYGEKQSFALVRDFAEKEQRPLGPSQTQHLAKGLQGIKVSTGQHPGGIVVVPREREIYDFTPIQHPADKSNSQIITTHFDFNSMHDTILKIDALGHDDPTMLKLLSDMTGVRILDIPIPDERVMALFASTEAIGIPADKSTIGSATIGLPEVGTMMAREMIQETKPKSFYDLVQLSGLSHGTDVWKGNAQELIHNGVCTLHDVIGCRDSIMTRLIYQGLEPETAFNIMEKVRKGKGLSPEHEAAMREKKIPEWYIDSCKKIKYLFPKAHAAAYSISTQRIAYFKVYYPEAFYCAWFTVRGTDFSYDEHILPAEVTMARRLDRRRNFMKLDKPEQKKFYILELVEEMQARQIDFLPVDIQLSEASHFVSPGKGLIRPPLDIIPGISAAMAQQVVTARQKDGPFKNIDALKRRSGLGDAAIAALRERGILKELPESAQITFFDLSGSKMA